MRLRREVLTVRLSSYRERGEPGAATRVFV